MKKKELVKFTAQLLNTFRHLMSDYQKAIGYANREVKIGDWAIEESYLGQTTIESILKITKIDLNTGAYEGTDILGEAQSWNNASFIPLSTYCQDYLNGKYKW